MIRSRRSAPQGRALARNIGATIPVRTHVVVRARCPVAGSDARMALRRDPAIAPARVISSRLPHINTGKPLYFSKLNRYKICFCGFESIQLERIRILTVGLSFAHRRVKPWGLIFFLV